MGFNREYFRRLPDDPAPLSVTTSRRVRFEEVDMLKIVWHGHYVSYLDDGRVALGERFPAVSYERLRRERIAAPIVQLRLDYQAPLFFGDVMEIKTTLFWSDALRLNFDYRIFNQDGHLTVSGSTVQLFTALDGATILTPPEWVEAFREDWRAGRLE